MIYGLQADASGATIRCSAWTSLPLGPSSASGAPGAPILPEGYTQCDENAYREAIAAMRETLPIQAGNALVIVNQQAAMTVAMGETFSPAMQGYVKSLRAIADGSDTVSTSLPLRPSS